MQYYIRWITGEDYVINWSTNPATTENWFAPGEPTGGTEGSVHIYLLAGFPTRLWNDVPGNLTSSSAAPFNQVIVEFNE